MEEQKGKKEMKRISIVMILVLSLVLCGCGMDSTGSWYTDHIYVDDMTGVNYIWINTDSGVTMCPRYNADGSLYVGK